MFGSFSLILRIHDDLAFIDVVILVGLEQEDQVVLEQIAQLHIAFFEIVYLDSRRSNKEIRLLGFTMRLMMRIRH